MVQKLTNPAYYLVDIHLQKIFIEDGAIRDMKRRKEGNKSSRKEVLDNLGFNLQKIMVLRTIKLWYLFYADNAADIARFMQPDPLATENHGVSPYTYCNGDPINFIDPTGEKVYFVNGTRRIISEEEAGSYNSLNMKEINAQYEGLDVVIIIDKDGKIIRQSETFDEGTIKLHDNSQSNLKGKDISAQDLTASVYTSKSRRSV